MCAIVDSNVVSEVFGSNLPPAGEKFFDWLNQGSGRLICVVYNLTDKRSPP